MVVVAYGHARAGQMFSDAEDGTLNDVSITKRAKYGRVACIGDKKRDNV